jgi:hypothetical protein
MNSGTGIGTGEENVKILLAEILRCCDSILEALDVPSSSSAAAGAGGTMKEQHTVIGGGSGALGAGALDGGDPDTLMCSRDILPIDDVPRVLPTVGDNALLHAVDGCDAPCGGRLPDSPARGRAGIRGGWSVMGLD